MKNCTKCQELTYITFLPQVLDGQNCVKVGNAHKKGMCSRCCYERIEDLNEKDRQDRIRRTGK